jgi:putative transposase
LKANSSKWIGEAMEFSWQEGYGASSISASNIDSVTRYVRNQEKHHRKFTFEEELRAILRRQGINYDPPDSLG